MRDVCSLIWLALIGLFGSRALPQAEILTLRHQLNVLRRKSPQRLGFTSIDRLVFAGLYRLAPGGLGALTMVGVDPGFMASFPSSASMSDKPPLQSIWRGEGDRRPKGGRRSFIITPTASRRWTCSWFRQSHSGCSMGC